MRKSPRKAKSPAGGRVPHSDDALSASTKEAIGRFVHVLARCGTQPDAILAAVVAECGRIPQGWIKRARNAIQEREDAGKLLTAWFTNPLTLKASGGPKWLPVSGGAASIEMLLGTVAESSDPSEVLEYLNKLGIIQRRGDLYAPKERYLALEKARLAKRVNGTDHYRTLRMLCHVLATFEHNVQPGVASRLEAFAENYRVPVDDVPEFMNQLRRMTKAFLEWADGELRRLELKRKPTERTQGVGVGIYAAEYAGPETRPRPLVGARVHKEALRASGRHGRSSQRTASAVVCRTCRADCASA